jgi:hypothetical protein
VALSEASPRVGGVGEPWDAKEAEKTAGVYETDMILTRKESGLKEMECGEPDVALYNKMGLGFKFRPRPAPEWYLQLTATQSARFAAAGERGRAEQQGQQEQAKDEEAPGQKPDVKTGECMFQRVGLLDAKPREYIVKGFIPRREVCNPFGRPDSFKGVTATQLAVHIAGGVDFLAMHVKQAPSAYFAGERAEANCPGATSEIRRSTEDKVCWRSQDMPAGRADRLALARD